MITNDFLLSIDNASFMDFINRLLTRAVLYKPTSLSENTPAFSHDLFS